MENVISVKGLSKKYQDFVAVNNFDMQVKKGEIIGLLGANGAGKSTTIECILGTKKGFSGEVSILGMNPKKDRKKLYQRVGVQFQETGYQPEIKVNELCKEISSLYKEPADYQKLLNEFGIADKENNFVKDLSGGERQRLFVILALLPNPSIVFLDELTTGLDVRARREVWKNIENMKKQGLTIILTSHFMDEVSKLCDRIIILKKGEKVFEGTISEAIHNSPCGNFEDAYLWLSGEELLCDVEQEEM